MTAQSLKNAMFDIAEVKQHRGAPMLKGKIISGKFVPAEVKILDVNCQRAAKSKSSDKFDAVASLLNLV